MGVDLHLGFRKHCSDMCHRGTGDLQKGDGSSEGGAGAGKEQWGILCPPCGMGSVSPPGVKEQRLVSWAQGQLLCSIVCSGHPLGQQR